MTVMGTGDLSAAAKTRNQDCAGSSATGAWVIDGATPLLPAESPEAVSDFAAAVSEQLSLVIEDAPTLRDALREAHLRALAGFPRPVAVTAVAAAARVRDGQVETLVLGDCTVDVVGPSRPPVRISDPSSAGVEEAFLAAVADHLAAGESSKSAYAAIQPLLIAKRTTHSRPGGSGWVLGDDADAAAHAHCETLPAGAGAAVLVATDGFDRLISLFGLATAEQAAVRLAADDGPALIEALRAAEIADRDRREHLRLSVHDDASAAWISL